VRASGIPTNYPETRADIGLVAKIVIPVVVGSSPISHPKAFSRTAPREGAVLHSPGMVCLFERQ